MHEPQTLPELLAAREMLAEAYAAYFGLVADGHGQFVTHLATCATAAATLNRTLAAALLGQAEASHATATTMTN